MFSKSSRYKKIKDIVTTDARGGALESKCLRLLPGVSGTFLHTIEENDCLDHLAFKYYKQSKKWWQICDANPEFMSPLALLGKEPIIISLFPVSFTTDDNPPWYKIIKRLSQIPGVQDAFFEEAIQEVKIVKVIYNRLNISAADLKKAIEDEDNRFNVGEVENIGRVGKKILIPANIVG